MADQRVGDTGHRRDDDGHLVPRLDFAGDFVRGAFNAFNIRDGGSAEFCNNQCHVIFFTNIPRLCAGSGLNKDYEQ